MPDEQLRLVISNGIPNHGMPAFRLIGQSQIKAIVAFVRSLQGSATLASFPGDPQRGKSVFFGRAACAECHMISGRGGFLASDLSSYGQSRSAAEIRKAIVEPSYSGSAGRSVSATTKDGQMLSGVVRNEDNFSIQIIDKQGKFHLLGKGDLTDLKYGSAPAMPTDYGEKLSSRELDDLVHYLQDVGSASKTQAHTTEED
jgi:cytochrome c oxidase cbb3-type subunit III